MAWLQRDPSDNYHVSFRFRGVRFKRSLRTKDGGDAEALRVRIERRVQLAESGDIEVPAAADLPTFFLSNGSTNKKLKLPKTVTLMMACTEFFASIPEGNIEQTTWKTMEIHTRHLRKHLGDRFRISGMKLPDLQNYVTKRGKEPGKHGNLIGPTTIKKELATFHTLWEWAKGMEYLSGPFPRKGLRLPKGKQKPPFQTWEQIEEQIERGDFTDGQQAELWECLFLSLSQIEEFLLFIKTNANRPFLYPMVAMAAYTGARRSELLRSQRSDIDGKTMLIHERKRNRRKQTTRRVPISSKLKTILDDWFEIYSGGQHTFCLDGTSITPDQAHDHFTRTLAGSKWEVVPGWHCFRHSFCSNCALKGVDQRMIDSWVGHTTEEMARRYRHLFPNSEQRAIDLVFA